VHYLSAGPRIIAVEKNVMLQLYLGHDVCNTFLKIKHVLYIYIASESAPPPPPTPLSTEMKSWVRARLPEWGLCSLELDAAGPYCGPQDKPLGCWSMEQCEMSTGQSNPKCSRQTPAHEQLVYHKSHIKHRQNEPGSAQFKTGDQLAKLQRCQLDEVCVFVCVCVCWCVCVCVCVWGGVCGVCVCVCVKRCRCSSGSADRRKIPTTVVMKIHI